MNIWRFRREANAASDELRTWGHDHVRSFPWRDHWHSPYQILIAELLVKRTTAAAAARAYPTFLAAFPNVASLHHAPPSAIESALRPVGLYAQRAKAIKAMAAYLIEVHKGHIPPSLPDLLKVPGIGPYSARAILSFGFGIPEAVVDSNVARVLKRVFAHDLGEAPTADHLQALADSLLPQKAQREHNYALLDLGALVCRYNDPRCGECPLAQVCDSAGLPAEGRKATLEGDALRAARVANRMSQARLAKEAGVSKATLVGIEYGRQSPKPQTLRTLHEAIGRYSVDPGTAGKGPEPGTENV